MCPLNWYLVDTPPARKINFFSLQTWTLSLWPESVGSFNEKAHLCCPLEKVLRRKERDIVIDAFDT